MSDTIIPIDTIAGVRGIPAPAGWEFDKTATIVWSNLMHYVRLERGFHKTKRDHAVVLGQCEVLAVVLANALGMAAPYWLNEARRLSQH